MSRVRVGIAGANGKMGRAIAVEVKKSARAALGGVFESPDHPKAGEVYADAPGLRLAEGPDALSGSIDVLIDFTAPSATAKHALWCAEHAVALVVGTTGLGAEHQLALDQAATVVPVVVAPNMSVGVNVLLALVKEAARMLAGDFQPEVLETHHRHKKDAPSGTAMALLRALQSESPGSEARFERHGQIGARPDSEIGVQTLRGGDVVGEHTVFFFGEGERVELTHRATDRAIFAAGALRAALWAVAQPAGRYGMAEVLKG